jgi:hypothetical protein
MMNFLGKSLVLLHTFFSILAVTYALWLFTRGRDTGYGEPRKEAIAWNAEGLPDKYVRHASEIDKSAAALVHAAENRDRAYVFVKPALDRIRETEPHLPYNHLHYVALMNRLRNSTEPIKVFRHKDVGLEITKPIFGKPIPADTEVEGLTKSFRAYEADLKELNEEIKKLDDESTIKVKAIKQFVRELTGTDENNKVVEPGLYTLLDLEFKAQTQLRVEIEEIKPYWSKATEQARLFVYRRSDLEATLQKLKGPMKK